MILGYLEVGIWEGYWAIGRILGYDMERILGYWADIWILVCWITMMVGRQLNHGSTVRFFRRRLSALASTWMTVYYSRGVCVTSVYAKALLHSPDSSRNAIRTYLEGISRTSQSGHGWVTVGSQLGHML